MHDLLVLALHGLVTELPADLAAAAVIGALAAVARAWRRRAPKRE
ncbi:hypothetical protein [Streptomyces sp. NPDC059278]|nr:hypothetical protein OH736_45075 [Streptomyces sp. NBC_01650]